MPIVRDWRALLDGEPVGVGGCTLFPGGEQSKVASATNSIPPYARGGATARRTSQSDAGLAPSIGTKARPQALGSRPQTRSESAGAAILDQIVLNCSNGWRQPLQ
jgi:hypothetical protein